MISDHGQSYTIILFHADPWRTNRQVEPWRCL